MKTSDYWQKRSEQIAKLQYDKADAYEAAQRKEYARATMEIKQDIEAFYARYATENGVDMAEARKILTKGEHRDFKLSLDGFIDRAKDNADGRWTQQLNNAYYKTRISRLEALQLQISQRIELLAGKRQTGTGELLGDIYKDTYYRNLYELHKGLGFGSTFAKVDDRGLESILGAKLDGRNWSQRIWDDRTKLKQQIQTKLSQSFIRGDTADRAIRDVVERLNVSKSNAERLIQTESAFFVGQATKAGYIESGVVKQYELLATLDSRTSPICRELDGKVFPVSEAQTGINYPPLHVRCRTTTVAYFGDEDDEERFARDPQGNYNPVPGNITYEQWQKEYIDRQDDDIFRAAEIMDKTDMRAKVGDENYSQFIDHLRNVDDPRTQRLYKELGDRITYSRVGGNKAYANGSNVQLTQESFKDSGFSNALRTVYHENGHALDYLGLQSLTGKTLVPTGRKLKKKVSGKTFEIDEMIQHASALPEYRLKETIERDLWEYVNGRDLPMYSDLGSKPRGKAEKAIWEDKRSEIYSTSTANLEKFEKVMFEKYGRADRRLAAISDIYESTSLTQKSYPFGIGHGKDYYKKAGMAETEFFAHVSESITTDQESYAIIKEIFPRSVGVWERIVDDIVKAGEEK